MCGICGILGGRSDPLEEKRSLVEQMKSRLRHRGPDGHGTHVSQYAVLGHRRLAIIDVDHGRQPMSSPDGRFVLVFNGEIYNYIELRNRLSQEGHHFATFSDTEVLLHVLMHYGESGVKRLNGMFAFVFLDTQTGRWMMGRDPFGIKPLYYTTVEGEGIIFASEIKALLVHPDVRAEVDWSGLNEYLRFQFCLNEKTLFRGIQKVQPGQYLLGTGGKVTRYVQYWDADFTIDDHHTEEYFVDRLRFLLEDSARLQVRSDVPLGAYLSSYSQFWCTT